jgi:hypothetical protein
MVAVLASEDGLAMQITTSEIGSGTAIGVAIRALAPTDRVVDWIARAGGVAEAHHDDASVYRIALDGPTRVGSGA